MRAELLESAEAGADLLGELEQAIDNNELRLHYQPQVSLSEGSIVGMEALIRWQHPRLGLLPPGRFLPAAEESGLIRQLTAWVLPTALNDLARWTERGLDISVAVNLSAQDLLDNEIVDAVLRQLDKCGARGDRLVVEITETSAIDNLQRGSDILAALRVEGIRVSLDDFGTGYSSLDHLAELPLDEMKLDRKLLEVTRDTDGFLLKSVAEIGHHLGLVVVGEGPETPADVQILIDAHVDMAQGYWFSKPVPSEEIETVAVLRLPDQLPEAEALS